MNIASKSSTDTIPTPRLCHEIAYGTTQHTHAYGTRGRRYSHQRSRSSQTHTLSLQTPPPTLGVALRALRYVLASSPEEAVS